MKDMKDIYEFGNIDTVDDVVRLFSEGIDCGQVIVYAVAKDLGIDPDTAVKMASPFGGGCFEGGICGSYVAGLMAVGMKYGYCKAGEQQQKVELIKKSFEFKEEYAKLQSSNNCTDILGANLTTEEGARIINDKNLLMTLCPKLTLDIINIVRNL